MSPHEKRRGESLKNSIFRRIYHKLGILSISFIILISLFVIYVSANAFFPFTVQYIIGTDVVGDASGQDWADINASYMADDGINLWTRTTFVNMSNLSICGGDFPPGLPNFMYLFFADTNGIDSGCPGTQCMNGSDFRIGMVLNSTGISSMGVDQWTGSWSSVGSLTLSEYNNISDMCANNRVDFNLSISGLGLTPATGSVGYGVVATNQAPGPPKDVAPDTFQNSGYYYNLSNFTVTGFLTFANGTPAVNLPVNLTDDSENLNFGTLTNSSGGYTIFGIPANSYDIEFNSYEDANGDDSLTFVINDDGDVVDWLNITDQNLQINASFYDLNISTATNCTSCVFDQNVTLYVNVTNEDTLNFTNFVIVVIASSSPSENDVYTTQIGFNATVGQTFTTNFTIFLNSSAIDPDSAVEIETYAGFIGEVLNISDGTTLTGMIASTATDTITNSASGNAYVNITANATTAKLNDLIKYTINVTCLASDLNISRLDILDYYNSSLFLLNATDLPTNATWSAGGLDYNSWNITGLNLGQDETYLFNITLTSRGTAAGDQHTAVNVTVYYIQGGNATFQRSVAVNMSTEPVQARPLLNSTFGTNFTTENLTVYNQSSTDPNNLALTNIINWYKNGRSLTLVHYPFEGASTNPILDFSGNNYSLSNAVGSPVWSATAGHNGFGGFTLDGVDDYLQTGNGSELGLTNKISVEAWVNPSNYNPTTNHTIIRRRGNTNNPQFHLGMLEGSFKFQTYTSSKKTVTSNASIAPNNWYHIVGTYNGSHIAIYVNGVLTGQQMASGNIEPSNRKIEIGYHTSKDWYWNGKVDEIRVWNSSLSPTYIGLLNSQFTDIVLSTMTAPGQTWNATITPATSSNMGATRWSNPLTILSQTFDYYGYTLDQSGSPLNGTNVSMEVYLDPQNTGFQLNTTVYVLSDENGFFNLSNITSLNNFLYKFSATLYNSTTSHATHVTRIGPHMSVDEMQGTVNTSYYLTEAGTINISAFNSTGDLIPVSYALKDTGIGYILAHASNNNSNGTQIIVPLNRNYSLMIWPAHGSTNQHFVPFSFDWTNFSSNQSYDLDSLSSYNTTTKTLHKLFNTTESFLRLYGYIDPQLISGTRDEMYIVPYLMEPGNMVSVSSGSLPYNVSTWNLDTDVFTTSNGFYNITVPYISTETRSYLLFATISNGTEYFGAFKNVTLGVNNIQNDTEINFTTVYGLLGDENNITMGDANGGQIQIPTKQQTFRLVNTTGQTLSDFSGNVKFTPDYSDYGAVRFDFIEWSNEGGANYSIPLLNVTGLDEVEIFTSDYAPKRISEYTVAEIQNNSNITLRSFNPTGINGTGFSNTNITLYTSNSTCSVPNPPSICILKNFIFNESTMMQLFSVVLGGGAFDFRMSYNNVDVHYVNVDMLASGPPDAMFDDQADQMSTGNTIQEVWRLGSQGPEIYSRVIIGIPYDSDFQENTMTVSIPYLYDEDWNLLWNTSSNGTAGIGGNLSEYADFNETWFDEMPCSTSDPTAYCYIDATVDKTWLRIPHFSGVGSSISGRGSSSSGSAGSGGAGGTWTKIRTAADCADGDDNDGDGYIDYPYDPGCEDYYDEDEENCWSEWECTDWPLCTEDGVVTRECEDLSECDTPTHDPILSKTCVYLPQEGEPVDEEEESGLSTITGAAVTEAIEESTGNIFKWYAKALLLAGLVVLVIFSYAVFKGGGGKDVLDLFSSKEGSYNSKKTTKMMTSYIKKRARRK